MLVSSKQMILDAQRGHYAVGSFNTSDLEITKAIISAAERQKAPVIVETSEKAIAYAGLEELAAIIKEKAKKAKVPVALHLDHGSSLEIVGKCLQVGYTSIMFDGSRLPLSENKIYTAQATEMAHRKGIPCEGELGPIKKVGEEKRFTNPEEVKDFIRKTKVDFLAIAVGSSHGVGENERLNLELLKQIKQKTNLPLVLHGASGVPSVDIQTAIHLGIAKINIDTDIRHTFARAVREIAATNLNDPRDMMNEIIKKIQTLVEEKIKLFKSNNKA